MSNERGFALIAALWLIVGLSAVGLELSLAARERRLAAANAIEATKTEAAAEAGIDHARARLARLVQYREDEDETAIRDSLFGPQDPWHRPGALFPDTVYLADVAYRIVLRDVGAALNVNRATVRELTRLLRSLRVDSRRADRVAQAIVDWRDPDAERQARGAEADDYLRAGSPVLPRNGPFQHIEELRFVRGMDDDLYRRVRPYLTLFGAARVNVNAAEREVLLALEGITDEAVAVIARLRRRGAPLRSLAELSRELSRPARSALQANMTRLLGRVTFDTREVEVLSEAWMIDGMTRSRVSGLFVRSDNSVFLVWQRKS